MKKKNNILRQPWNKRLSKLVMLLKSLNWGALQSIPTKDFGHNELDGVGSVDNRPSTD